MHEQIPGLSTTVLIVPGSLDQNASKLTCHIHC